MRQIGISLSTMILWLLIEINAEIGSSQSSKMKMDFCVCYTLSFFLLDLFVYSTGMQCILTDQRNESSKDFDPKSPKNEHDGAVKV